MPDIELTPEQQDALRDVVRWRNSRQGGFYALTGPAGTGKTTLVDRIDDACSFAALTALTGKAALRLGECVSGRETSTLHKILYYPPDPGRDVRFERVKPAAARSVLVDESSMTSPQIYADLQRWVDDGVQVLLVGDEFQLPPVVSEQADRQRWGEDFSVFSHVEGSRLRTVMRSAGAVLQAATRVRETGQICRESLQDDRSRYDYVEHHMPLERAVEDYLDDRDDHMLVTWRNETRMQACRRIRELLDLEGPLPDPGEPVLIRQNGQGFLNGEIVVCDGWETGPTLGENKQTGAPGLFTMWMRVQNRGRVLVTVQGGGEDPEDERFFDGSKPWVQDWRAYHIDLREQMLPQPIPVTFGYVLTAHTCVHPDTIVETPKGLVRIKTLQEEGVIATPTGVKDYNNLITNPVGTMLRVRTRDGYTLDVTPDHGLFVWDGEVYSRTEARNVKPGLLLQFGLSPVCDPSDLRTLPPPALHSDVLDSRAATYRFPKIVDGDTAEFFGMVVADGTLFDRGFRFIKQHRDVVLRFGELAHSIFGVDMQPVNTGERYHPNVTGVEAHSVQITRWLTRLGGMSPKEKDVPTCILESPLSIQARFLRGLFEDGTVNLKNGVVDHIAWSTCRESLATTVHIMLLRFGIIAYRGVREPREDALSDNNQHIIYIYGISARRFRDLIGFVSKWKQDRLVERGGDSAETRYGAPFSRSEILAIAKFLSKTERSNWHSRGKLSRHVMRRAIVRGAIGEARAILDEKLRWHHSAIVSVERIADAPSMCVTVPDGHRFLQNGSPQSNCQGSQARRVSVFLSGWDLRSSNFNKQTTLPTGEYVSFSSRWCYTAQTRSQFQTNMIVGTD